MVNTKKSRSYLGGEGFFYVKNMLNVEQIWCFSLGNVCISCNCWVTESVMLIYIIGQHLPQNYKSKNTISWSMN